MERSPAVPDSDQPRLLILGGTTEAAALARSLVGVYGDRLAVTTSLAGRTSAPAALPGAVRHGGFGGAAALATYLQDRQIDAVIDATHPFAAQISANAVAACEAAKVPRLVLSRPRWSPQPGDDWIYFDTVAAAAESLPRYGRRAFLTVGWQELSAFAAMADMWFLVRLIEMPSDPLPIADCQVVTGRGPCAVQQEKILLETQQIDVLVTKASGGAATAAKLGAARLLGLPVVMVRRPPPPPGPRVDSVGAAAKWVSSQLGT